MSNRNCSRVLFVFAVLCNAAAVIASAQAKHPVTFEDLQTIKNSFDMHLSPNGAWLAYAELGGDVWIVSTKPGSTPRKVAKGTLPIWSPDNIHLAYYAAWLGVNQLLVFNRKTGRTERITNVKGGIDPNMLTQFIGLSGFSYDPLLFSWSPDGSKIVFASQVGDSEANSTHGAKPTTGLPMILTNTTPPALTIAGLFVGGTPYPRFANGKMDDSGPILRHRANQLYVVDIHRRRLKQLTTDDQDYFTPDWSPDGRKIVCVSSEGRPLAGHGSGPTNLYLIDAETGLRTALTSDSTFYKRVPKWSPDGKWIAFNRAQKGHDEHISVIPAAGGEAISLHGSDESSLQFEWAPDSEGIFFVYQNGTTEFLSRVELRSKRITNIVSDPAARLFVGVSGDGTIAWSQSDPKHHDVVYTMVPGSGWPSLILDLNPQIESWLLGEQEVVHWKNRRGDALEGVVVKPLGYDAEHTYPLIIDAYPGSYNSFEGFGMSANHIWAARGYVLFWPTMRTPNVWTNPSNSKAFDEAAKGPEGIDLMVDDIMSGVDELIRRGVVDEQRMGLYGFSNGGAVVNQLVTKTGRFKCAVSVSAAASTDWISLFFQYTAAQGIAQIAGAAPWEDPNRWVQLSTIFRMDKVTTPMLLAAGDNEVPLRVIEEYNGLRYLGRDVTLLRYPNQGHGFEGAALKDFTERALGFFDQHLKRPN